MTQGCVHVHVADGVITKVVLHLSALPAEGVVHLVPEEELTVAEFLSSHPIDAGEVDMPPSKQFFDLGDDVIPINSGHKGK